MISHQFIWCLIKINWNIRQKDMYMNMLKANVLLVKKLMIR